MIPNLLSLVVLSFCFAIAYCSFSASLNEAIKLIDLERYLLGKMEKFVTLNENKLDFLKQKLSEFESESDEQDADDELSENAINMFLLTKHLSLDWELMVESLNEDVGTRTLKSIDKFRQEYKFPAEDDVNGAMIGLLRLQKIYRLYTKDIAQGILAGIKDGTEISAKDCFDIGKFALKDGNLFAARAWLLEALDRFDSYEQTEIDTKFDKNDILKTLEETRLQLVIRRLEGVKNEFGIINSTTKPNVYDLYEATCRGDLKQSPAEERPLRCMYVNNNVPFLKIAPIKMEQLSLDPFVVQFHEVIYDNEIEKVINITKSKLVRSFIGVKKELEVSRDRTSANTWIYYNEHDFLAPIKQRFLDMTQMSLDSAEPLQVVNYGIGGQYNPHYDFSANLSEVYNNWDGNRIATALFYISDVELGGGTAFPFLKVLVKPVRNSMVIWYNLHDSTDPDYRTVHAGCPVLKGSKWVIIELFHTGGQEFKKPCGLQLTKHLSEEYINY